MRALVSVPSIRPTTPRSSTRRRRDTPATRRGFGGRRVLNNPTRAVVHSDPTPRLPATAGGFFGDLDVAARTETRAAPAPHVVDRPPPGVVDHFPPPPVPHDEALSPFGPLEPEHGASHTRTSTHARHPHTIRIILTRPIDKHLAFVPAHAPAQHCALTELAVSKRAPKARPTPREKESTTVTQSSNFSAGPERRAEPGHRRRRHARAPVPRPRRWTRVSRRSAAVAGGPSQDAGAPGRDGGSVRYDRQGGVRGGWLVRDVVVCPVGRRGRAGWGVSGGEVLS